MIPVSNQAIATRLTNGDTVKCDFSINFITMSLDIDSSDIWEGGIEFDDSVSSDSEFQFGTAIINKCTITINNNTGKFDSYEFENQHLEISVFLINPDNPTEYADINKGCYIVNEATYTDNLITIECYDRMFLFDTPYDDATCEYPATLEEIVQSACFDLTPSYSGGDTIFGSFQSDLKDITINRKPQTGTTYREVISWAAQITGCFARFNSEGKLDLKWFPNSPNCSVSAVFNKSLSKHSYSVTGVKATYKLYAENEEVLYGNEITSEPVIEAIPDSALSSLDEKEIETAYNEVSAGSDGYVVELKDNEFLSSENVHAVVYYLYNKIHGFTVRRATVTNIGNILIEAGDYINVQDTKHNSVIPIRITGVRYTSGGSQTLTSAGESASISATVGNSVETRNYMNNANRATQIEYNVAREFDKEIQYKNGDYTTYNNLFYRYVGDEEEEIEDDDWADWEHEVNTGENGDDPDVNEPIIFNATHSSTSRLLGSGGTANLLGSDNDVTVDVDSDDEPSGADKNGFDKSKWQRVVLTDELFFQLARRIARPYKEETEYEKGDFVYYDKNFYECKEDIAESGDFDESKWKKIIISDYLFFQLARRIARPYQKEKEYEKGDFVYYDKNFYECKEDIAESGIFDESKWKNIIISDYLKKKNDWWIGTESEYDALEEHEEDVIYFLYED